VMMMAMTPSLNASRRPLLTAETISPIPVLGIERVGVKSARGRDALQRARLVVSGQGFEP
jgi:hypothetical protein